MSNKSTSYDFSKTTPELVARIDVVLKEAQAHTYSVSRVYDAYNEAMGTKDAPQSCPSCLRARVKELQDWKRQYDEAQKAPAKAAKPAAATAPKVEPAKVTTPAAPAKEALTLEQEVKDGEAGQAFAFTPGEDLATPNKGTVKYLDGTAVKPGKYALADGSTLAVQVAGKATVTAGDLL